jgi:Mce-associated membrane protein
VSDGLPGPGTETDVIERPEPQEPAVKGLDRRRSVLGSARLAWGVAVLALALAVFAGTQWADLYAAERTRAEVRQEATGLVLNLTTFEGENIEEWVADAQSRATGEYAEQLSTLFDQSLRDALREQEVVSRGEVDQLFVQDIAGDRADVFALVTQTIVNATTSDPVQDELRMDITMQRVDGQWLASDVAVLGPAGLVGGAPQAPGAPEGEPAEEGGQ